MSGKPGFVDYEGYTLEDALASVGEGWAPLIKEVFEKKPPKTNIVQVKEKFGGLRIYTDRATQRFEKVIEEAEKKSYKTCEWCGKPGSLDQSRWYVLTLCEEDKEKRRQQKEKENVYARADGGN